jgi:formylglycine-generating enzyme required for sulfatase activity
MQRWFLSYNSQDLALIDKFETALRHKIPDAEIFYAPRSLRVGGFWLPELAEHITASSAFVLLVGEKGLGPWQVPEYYEALDKRVKSPGFPVMLVLLAGQPAPGLPFLRQLHWIVSPDPASEQCLAQVIEAASGEGGRPRELWRHTAPYRGLAAMTEADSDFFFGREQETIEVIRTLEAHPNKLPMLLGNSGVGKSSLAQAGVLASLARQGWPEQAAHPGPWPQAFRDSRRWCYLTMRPGAEPVKALVEPFLHAWQFEATDPVWAERRAEWIEALLGGRLALHDLLDATERRYAELGQLKPPKFFLYVDQGEELYVRSEERERRRFSEILAHGLDDQRLRAMMSIRSDFLGSLQNDQPLYGVHLKVDVPPLHEKELREVVSRPAELLSARFETDRLADEIAQRTAEDSAKDAGALPLLSYLLDDMWTQMIKRGDGVLRLPVAAVELGGALAERANAFLARHPGSEEQVRRLLTLKLATVREDGEPTRRQVHRSEFSDEEWRLVSELADHPNRLLVTATPDGEAYAEVAHEAIFKRWQKLRDWVVEEREFLVWRSGLDRDRHRWETAPKAKKNDALLMGLALAQAQSWLEQRGTDLTKAEREFITGSIQREVSERAQRDKLRRRTWQLGALLGMLFLGIGAGLAWSSRTYIEARAVTLGELVWPKVLTSAAERALKPGGRFAECSGCPEMVVVPAGQFMMGSPPSDKDRFGNEEPLHQVTIARQFAVSRFEITFDQYDACVLLGGCPNAAYDQRWGRDTRPVINVNWQDAEHYVAWLSQRTGKRYRLLSETEWEYVARAGTQTVFPWGDEVGQGNANCNGCGSKWDHKQTAPVGSFAANKFGLYDMVGNAYVWVQDCYRNNYVSIPVDGAPFLGSDCDRRVARGGSWFDPPIQLRAANRDAPRFDFMSSGISLRVARTLAP